jgi:cephalosporin-C deacetylase
MESALLTRSYPYEEINEYLRRYPDQRELVRDTVAYFDGINFASQIQAPMFVFFGLEDDVCPPETSFAVYRAIAGPKELHAFEKCAHHDAGRYWAMPKVRSFLANYLEPKVND